LSRGIIGKYPDLMPARNRNWKTPLHVALEKSNFRWVRCIITGWETLLLENTRQAIIGLVDDSGGNCLHLALKSQSHYYSEDYYKMLDLIITSANRKSFSVRDTSNNTPLHLAVEGSRCTSERHVQLVKRLLTLYDGASDSDLRKPDFKSPYSHHLGKDKDDSSGDGQKSGRDIKDEFVVGTMDTNKHPRAMPALGTETGVAMSESFSPSRMMSLVLPTLGMVPLRMPDSKRRVGAERDNVPVKRSIVATAQRSDEKLPNCDFVNKVTEVLRLHYLRTKNGAKATQIIYGKNPDSKSYPRLHLLASVLT